MSRSSAAGSSAPAPPRTWPRQAVRSCCSSAPIWPLERRVETRAPSSIRSMSHFAALHQASLELYRELSDAADGFDLAERPAGLMLVSFDEAAVVNGWIEPRPRLARACPGRDPGWRGSGIWSRRWPRGSLPAGSRPATRSRRRRPRWRSPGAPAARCAGDDWDARPTPTIESGRISGVRLENGDRICQQVRCSSRLARGHRA